MEVCWCDHGVNDETIVCGMREMLQKDDYQFYETERDDHFIDHVESMLWLNWLVDLDVVRKL